MFAGRSDKAINFLLHASLQLLTGLALSEGLSSGWRAAVFVAYIPWMISVERGSVVAVVVGALLAGSCAALVAFDFALIPGRGGTLKYWIWLLGSVLFGGINWAASTWLAWVLYHRRLPRFLVLYVAWFLFEANLVYSSELLIDGGIRFWQLGAMQDVWIVSQTACIGGVTIVGATVVAINCVLHVLVELVIVHRWFAAMILTGLPVLIIVERSASGDVEELTSKETLCVAITGAVIKVPDLEIDAILPSKPVELVVFGECCIRSGTTLRMPKVVTTRRSLRHEPANTLRRLSHAAKAPLIVGAFRRDPGDDTQMWNSTILVLPDTGVRAAYDKQRLAIQTELRPRIFRFVDWLVGRSSDPSLVVPGRTSGPAFILPASELRIGTTVCYDLFFDQPYYDYVALESASVDLFVNCASHRRINDRLDQLTTRYARLRAIEYGRPLIHLAIDGISCVFDCYGRQVFRSKTPQDITAPNIVNVPLSQRATVFMRFDPVRVDVCFGIGLLLSCIWFMRYPSRIPCTGLLSKFHSGRI